jgi:hypothetical protein
MSYESFSALGGWHAQHASNSHSPTIYFESGVEREKNQRWCLSVEREINLIKTSNRQLLMFGARQRLSDELRRLVCVHFDSTIHFSCVFMQDDK